MGFGLLLFGYIIAFVFIKLSYYFFADVIGAILIMLALRKLMSYDKYYYYAEFSILAYMILALFNGINIVFPFYEKTSVIYYIVISLKALSILAFHYLYLKASFNMCNRAELPKYAKKCKRAWYITIVYMVLDLFVILFSSSLGELGSYIALVTLFFGMYWILLNAFLIYRMFSLICEEGDEAALPKKSKFKFVNKINSVSSDESKDENKK